MRQQAVMAARRRDRRPLLAIVLLWLIAAPAAALVVHPDASVTLDDPALLAQFADFGWWTHVGRVGDGSAIYLDNGWVLTANHVGAGTFHLHGQSYSRDQSVTPIQLTNPNNSASELLLFKLNQKLPLPAMTIADQPPITGDTVLILSEGRIQEPSSTTWSVNTTTSPWSWTTPPNHPTRPRITGYLTTEDRALRWGLNELINDTSFVSLGPVGVWGFDTRFDSDGLPYEAQPVKGDSGGGVFVQVDGGWALTGMITAITTLSGQPGGNTSAMLDYSQALIADLTVYRDQILDIIFEPVVVGDLNGDGLVNTADINPFILALTDPAAFATVFPHVNLYAAGDINGDGQINTADINPFVALLTSGMGTGLAAGLIIPEPAALTLLAWGAAMLLMRRR
jgi:hypothetical protein